MRPRTKLTHALALVALAALLSISMGSSTTSASSLPGPGIQTIDYEAEFIGDRGVEVTLGTKIFAFGCDAPSYDPCASKRSTVRTYDVATGTRTEHAIPEFSTSYPAGFAWEANGKLRFLNGGSIYEFDPEVNAITASWPSNAIAADKTVSGVTQGGISYIWSNGAVSWFMEPPTAESYPPHIVVRGMPGIGCLDSQLTARSGALYLVGGTIDCANPSCTQNRCAWVMTPLPTVFSWEPSIRTVSLPARPESYATSLDSGKLLILLGGSSGSGAGSTTIRAFDTETETLCTLTQSFQVPRSHLMSARVGTHIYLLGGLSHEGGDPEQPLAGDVMRWLPPTTCP